MSQLTALILALVAAGTASPQGASVLIEAEAFEGTGGLVSDQQFMDLMGSPTCWPMASACRWRTRASAG